LEHKYNIGDVVYYASTTSIRKQHNCPDCLGGRKWEATSPAGDKFEFTCPRCTGGYKSHGEISVDYTCFIASVTSLTIGSVQINTASKQPVKYMCQETGVGSGTVYDEKRLFLTASSAEEYANILAEENNAKIKWVLERYNRTLHISDYQLTSAILEGARKTKTAHEVGIRTLFDDLRESQSLNECHEIIENFEFTN